MIHPNSSEQLVFRQVAFPVSAFDYLKDFQRDIERRTGERLNNNQVLARILAEHQQSTVESEEHGNTGNQART
jgi:hypothetical protein